jgi:hypothetical protein
VLVKDTGARATYEAFRSQGQTPLSAILDVHANNLSAQASIRRCARWSAAYLGGGESEDIRRTGGRSTSIYWDPDTGMYGVCVGDTPQGASNCAAQKCRATSAGHVCVLVKECDRGGGGAFGAVASANRALGATCGAPSMDAAISAAMGGCQQRGSGCAVVDVWQH